MPAHSKTAITFGLILAASVSTVAFAAPGGARDADRAEIREEVFNRFDEDGDGQFSREDLEALSQTRFADSDVDGDGFLSADELRAATEKRLSERAERMSARMLERLDQDGDGKLSFQEASADGKRGDRMFERADADGDGIVTRSEFMSVERGHGRPFRHGRQ